MSIVEDACTDEFKLTPSATMKEEYSDNILYTSGNTQKDFITTLSPGLALTNKTERMNLSLSGRLDHRLYSSYSGLNATDQYYESAGRYAFTERFNLSGKALYSRDSRPDRDIETTGLALTSVIRKRWNYSISGDYLLSEKLLTSFMYDYSKDDYDSLFYTDLEAHNFDLGFIRDLGDFFPSTKGRMNVGYAKYNMPNIKMDNYESTIGIERAFNEKWSLLVDGGGRYTRSTFKFNEYELVPVFPPFIYTTRLVEREDRTRGWGGVGQLTLTYSGEKGNSNGYLSVAHNILPASGRSGASERTSFILSMRKRFTYELYGNLWAGYHINKSSSGEFSTQKTDENTITVSPSVRYQFDKDKSIEASYTYNRTKYNVTGDKAERNVFQVRFRIQHDLFE